MGVGGGWWVVVGGRWFWPVHSADVTISIKEALRARSKQKWLETSLSCRQAGRLQKSKVHVKLSRIMDPLQSQAHNAGDSFGVSGSHSGRDGNSTQFPGGWLITCRHWPGLLALKAWA